MSPQQQPQMDSSLSSSSSSSRSSTDDDTSSTDESSWWTWISRWSWTTMPQQQPQMDSSSSSSSSDDDEDQPPAPTTLATTVAVASIPTTIAATTPAEVRQQQQPRRNPLISAGFSSVNAALNGFATAFEARYGSHYPPLYRGTIQEALIEALDAPGRECEARRPLALYLHTDESPEADFFARTIICSPQVLRLLSANFVVWPWDLSVAVNRQMLLEWLSVLNMDSTAKFVKACHTREPMLIVIIGRSSTLIQPTAAAIFAKHGSNGALSELMIALTNHQRIKHRCIGEEKRRSAAEQLRQAQADEYQQSKADHQAELEKLKKAEQLKAEEAKKRVEAEQKQQERRKQLAATLPEEPALTNPDVVTIRLRTPDGRLVEDRRFGADSLIELLYVYAEVQGYGREQYGLFVSEVPLKELNPLKTFAEMCWNPKRVLVVIIKKS